MKYAIFNILMLFTVSVTALDAPETIQPKTKVIRPLSWYAGQSASWKEKLEQRPADPEGWLNYYAASRYAQNSIEELNEIARKAEAVIANTFEGKIIRALNEGYSKNSFDHLMEAYQMKPDNAGTYGALMLFNEFNLDATARTEFSNKLLSSGQVSQALLSYSYNVLMSVENNATLFVEGDNTTLPLFILQDVMKVRKDVNILNLDILTLASYRDGKLRELGLNPFTAEPSGDQKKLLCALLPEQNPGKKFYYALTMGRDNLSDINNQLYVVGLASQISKERLDNISVIKENLEKRFLMDYLLVDFNGESEFSSGKVLSSNYLVSMLLLNEQYLKSGDSDKAMKLQVLFTKIASETGKTELVDNFLNREKGNFDPIVIIDLNTKSLEGLMKPVKDNLYASSIETTNEQYNLFLDYLMKNNPSLYEKCKADLSQYDGTSLALFKGYHTYIHPVVVMRGKNNYGYRNYPMINITHDGAIAYCEWLTEQYNGNANRKFKKVKFRLPTLKEWQIAALGDPNFQTWDLEKNVIKSAVPKNSSDEFGKGSPVVIPFDETILYPWYNAYNYRNKAQNSKNCFLGNFKAPENCKPCATAMVGFDGFSMMSVTGAYFPNGMGLYDVVGNVAEMIDEDGKACGGSWNQSPEESTIRSVSQYKGPNASVGFRIFMEVIEK